jgi:Predicted membrane protein (DUF2254)
MRAEAPRSTDALSASFVTNPRPCGRQSTSRHLRYPCSARGTDALRITLPPHVGIQVGRLDTERSFDQDLAYGPRLLVDICVRSLAEPFDPTTAVQAIDRLHDFLRQLVHRKFPSGEYRDQAGTVRVVIKTLSWDDYCEAGA